MIRILVTGSRFWDDEFTFIRGLTVAIEDLTSRFPGEQEIVIVHGDAKGADIMSESYVNRTKNFFAGHGITIRTERHPADWNTHGKAAGPIRNQKMVDLGADMCVAFLKRGEANKGTKNCIAAARRAGIEVVEFEDKD